MKKNILLTLVFSLTALGSLVGQSAKKSLNYQAVILDPKAIDIPGASLSGQPLSKGKVCLKFSFVNAQGNVDYEETQQTTTDEYGLVSLAVGTGTYNGGTFKNFESIVWDANVKSMRVAVSYDGCTSFKQVSTQALNYTPYALYAEAVDYKNVKDAPTKLSQFSNDAGYLIPKDLDPLKADIKTNTADIKTNAADIKTNTADIKTNTADIKTNAGQIASANQSISDNKKSSDESFLVVNQSIRDLGTKVTSNTNSIVTIEGKINEQQNLINDTRNQLNNTTSSINGQINGLQNQVNTTANTVNTLVGDAQIVANKSTATNLGGASPSDVLYPSQKAAKTYVDNAIYNAVGTGVADATTLAPGKVQLAGDLAGTATAPTVPGLANKENLSNKSTSTSLGTSNDLYPTQNAVKVYVDQATQGIALQAAVDAKADKNSPVFTGTPNLPTGTIAVTQTPGDNTTNIATTAFVQAATAAGIIDASSTTKGKLKLTGDLGGTAESPTVPGLALKANSTDVNTSLALKENTSNKSSATALGTSNDLYPTQNAVKVYVDAQIASATIADADASTKGKIQLAGDLGGTAASPTVPGLALKANSADVNASLALKAPINNPTFTGTVAGITSGMVGLGNVDNTSDASKPVSTATQTALDLKAPLASPTFTGSPSLPTGTTAITQSSGDNSTKLATTEFVTTKLAAGAPDATTTATGKVQLAGDLGGTASAPTVPGLALKANSADVNTSLALKAPINNPTFTGTVGGITSSMVGLGNVDNTSDANKPVSTATQTALDLKASLASPTFTGSPSLPTGTTAITQLAGDNSTKLATTEFVTTKLAAGAPDATTTATGKVQLAGDLGGTAASPTVPGLALKANTADVNTSLGLKAPINNPTFTGTVAGITSSMVGLGNVDNTSDANKPVSTATQTALDLKASLASPTFTGAPTAPTATAGTNTTQIATTEFVTTSLASANISIGTIAGSSTTNGASITSGVINLAPADGTNGGIVTTETQTIAGAKTFTSDAIVNGITVGKGGGNKSGNTAIGISALLNNSGGDYNTASGERALSSNTDGNENTANGWRALYLNTTGNKNTVSGSSALLFNADGNSNTAIGYRAGRKIADDSGNNTTSDFSVYLGSETKASSDGAQNEIVIGYNAIGAGSNTIQLGNTSITNVKTSGTLTAGDVTYPKTHGTSGQVLGTTGSGSLTWTTPATISIGAIGTATTNGASIASGVLSLTPADGTNGGIVTTGTQTIAGAKTFTSDAIVNGITVGRGGGDSGYNTAFGLNALLNNTGSGNTAVGRETLIKNENSYNSAFGYQALKENKYGSYNVAVGSSALFKNTDGSINVAIGNNSLSQNTVGSNNTAIGNNTLTTNTIGSNNTAIGNSANVASADLTNATALGYQAKVSASNTIQLGADGTWGSVAITNVKTSGTLTAGTVTYPNTPGTSGQVLTTDGTGTATWADASGGVPYTGATGAVNLGAYDLTVNGIKIGSGGGSNSTNTAIGFDALSVNAPDGDNDLGINNTAIGMNALLGNITGANNTATGRDALFNNTTGLENAATGAYALFNNTTGSYNTAYGKASLLINTEGSNNTAIGYGADVGSDNLTNATAIGNRASVTTSNTIQLGNTDVTDVKTSGTLTAGDVTYPKTHGTSGQVLGTTGSGSLTWTTPATISIGTIAGSSTANGASITSGVINLAPADETNGGIVTTGTQTFVGAKTFTSDAIVNGITVGRGGGNVSTNVATGSDALKSNTTGNKNTAIGYFALEKNTNSFNTAIGSEALKDNTSGDNNTASGASALTSNTTGVRNTAYGSSTLLSNTTGAGNTAIGISALMSNTTNGALKGDNNTAIGNSALRYNTTGSDNTASGTTALIYNTTGSANTAIGNYAGSYIANGSTDNTTSDYSVYLGSNTKASADDAQNEVVIGYNAIGAGSNTIQLGNTDVTDVKTSGTLTAGDVTYPKTHGTSGQVLGTTGSGSLTWTTPASISIGAIGTATTNGASIASGVLSLTPADGTNGGIVTTGTQTFAGAKTFTSDAIINGITVGRGSGTDSMSTAIGYKALFDNTGIINTAIGFKALTLNQTGSFNTASGAGALYLNTTGDGNTASSYGSLYNNTSGSYNTANGAQALSSNTTGSNNTAIGGGALMSNTAGDSNTAIGYLAGVARDSLTNATAIGAFAEVEASNTIQLGAPDVTNVKTYGTLTAGTVTYPKTHNSTSGQVLTIDNAGTATWAAAAGGVPYTGATGAVNLGAYDLTVNGIKVGLGAGNVSSNTVIGSAALTSNTTGNFNIAVGMNALSANTTGSYNTAIGVDVLKLSTGGFNTAYGTYALEGNITGTNNVAVGIGALSGNITGNNNTAIGDQANVADVGLTNATAIGNGASVTASNTIQLGNSAVTNVITSGNLTVAGITVGRGSGGVSSNSVIGFEALASNTASGISNTAIGNRALTANTTGSYNAAIGHDAGRYIFSISPTNNTTSDYSVYLGSDTKASADNAQNEIVIGYNAIGAGSNTIRLGNDAITGVYTKGTVHVNGVALSSDLRLKSNIAPLANSLATVMQLNPVHYMKKGSLASKAYNREENGFIAQEIQKILPFVVTEGTDENKLLSVDYNSFIPVLTKAIQEQQKQIEDQNAKITAQQKQIEELIKLVKGQK